MAGSTGIPEVSGGSNNRTASGGGSRPVSGENQSSSSNSSAPPEARSETVQQKLSRINADSSPFAKLNKNVEHTIKQTTAKKIFPYSKFLMKEEDVNKGYVQLCFIELGWNGNDSQNKVKRARVWRQLGQQIIKQCADRRARALSAIKRACLGKSIVCNLLFVTTTDSLSFAVFCNRLSEPRQGGECGRGATNGNGSSSIVQEGVWCWSGEYAHSIVRSREKEHPVVLFERGGGGIKPQSCQQRKEEAYLQREGDTFRRSICFDGAPISPRKVDGGR